MGNKLFPIMSLPGSQMDGSPYATDFYIGNQHCRWQRGLPRKIGGYQQITTLSAIPRGMFVQATLSTDLNIYVGTANQLVYIPMNQLGAITGPPVDRTPAFYVPNPNNQWTFDNVYVNALSTTCVLAHAAPNLLDIASNTETPVYYGPVVTNTALISTGIQSSGGMVSLSPYVVYYGQSGKVQVSVPGDPTTIASTFFVTQSAIVNAKQIRGGNSSPAALLWSLDSVIKMTQAGVNGLIDWRFDTLSDETSIMSSNSVIEYDSRYFWIGVDKFFVYNGVVQELPNAQSTNFFFDNVNIAYRELIWATKVPHYNEIWFFYPHGNVTECNHALIYNLASKTWYDTAINRSCGYYPQVFSKPIWADNQLLNGTYSLWMHETGVDQVVGNTSTAIDSYYETSLISFASRGPTGDWTGNDRWTNLVCMEPDFATLTGTMTFTVNGKEYQQQSTTQSSAPYSFDTNTTVLYMNGSGEQRRFMTLKFESNVVGGNYQAGQILLEFGLGDARK